MNVRTLQKRFFACTKIERSVYLPNAGDRPVGKKTSEPWSSRYN